MLSWGWIAFARAQTTYLPANSSSSRQATAPAEQYAERTDNLEFNFFFKLCGQLVVVIFIQDEIANLLSSKQGNAHNLIHTLSNKTLNLCSILQIKTGYIGPSAKVQNIRLQCTRQGAAKIDYCGCHLICYLVIGSQKNITHGTRSSFWVGWRLATVGRLQSSLF